ncbi:MarR family winged helix-turn-helix transcriptional regulator [Microbacterium sp. P5_E9]
MYLDARNAAMIAARRRLNINEMDAKALMFIVDNPGTRPTTLRDYLGITSAGITTLIDRLVDRGAVRRDIDTVDRRVNRITATIDTAVEPWSALSRFDDEFDTAAGGIDPTRTEELAAILNDLTAAVSTSG